MLGNNNLNYKQTRWQRLFKVEGTHRKKMRNGNILKVTPGLMVQCVLSMPETLASVPSNTYTQRKITGLS